MDVIFAVVAFFDLSLYSKSVFSYINLNMFYKKPRVNIGYWKEQIHTSYGATYVNNETSTLKWSWEIESCNEFDYSKGTE